MSMEGAANQENSINFDNNWCRSLANEEGDVDEDERKPRNINRETMNDCVGQDSSTAGWQVWVWSSVTTDLQTN